MNHESLYLGIDPALVNVFIIFAPFSRLNVPLQDAPALTGRALAGGPIVTVNAESGVKGERDSRIIPMPGNCVSFLLTCKTFTYNSVFCKES